MIFPFLIFFFICHQIFKLLKVVENHCCKYQLRSEIKNKSLTCHMTSNLSCYMLLRPPNSLFRKLLLSLLSLLRLTLLLLSIHLVTTKAHRLKNQSTKTQKNHNTAICLQEKNQKLYSNVFRCLSTASVSRSQVIIPDIHQDVGRLRIASEE